MNRPVLLVAFSLPLVVCGGIAAIGHFRMSRIEASLARSEQAIARLEAEARKAANQRTIFEALGNPPPGLNQLPPPSFRPVLAAPAGVVDPSSAQPSQSSPPGAQATVLAAATQENVQKFLLEAKIGQREWDAVQKANLDAKSAAQLLSRQLPDNVDPGIAESKLTEIEDRRRQVVDQTLKDTQRQAYETFRQHAGMDSVVALSEGRVRRYLWKY